MRINIHQKKLSQISFNKNKKQKIENKLITPKEGNAFKGSKKSLKLILGLGIFTSLVLGALF